MDSETESQYIDPQIDIVEIQCVKSVHLVDFDRVCRLDPVNESPDSVVKRENEFWHPFREIEKRSSLKGVEEYSLLCILLGIVLVILLGILLCILLCCAFCSASALHVALRSALHSALHSEAPLEPS